MTPRGVSAGRQPAPNGSTARHDMGRSVDRTDTRRDVVYATPAQTEHPRSPTFASAKLSPRPRTVK